MAAHAGETARRTHVFHCARCGATVRVQAGDVIPPCPNGHTEFTQRMQEARRKG